MERLKAEPIVILGTGYMAMPISAHRFPAAVDGIDFITDLYNERKGKAEHTRTFDFFKRAAEQCAYTYGDFHQWARVHAVAAKISTTQFDFIIDTIRFIKTGRRTMNLSNWIRVVKYDPDIQITESQHAVRLELIAKALDGVSNNPVPCWCSHEGGLDDLIITTALMFGDNTKLSSG